MTDIIQRLQVTARPNSYDPVTRTFTAVVATNDPVEKGTYLEVFDLDSIGLPNRLPLQADHSTSSRQTLGDLINFRMETLADGTRAMVADAQLSDGVHTQVFHDNLRSGKQHGLSIGLRPMKWRESIDPTTRKKTRTAIAGNWVEASFVVEPADPKAIVRNANMEPETNPAETETAGMTQAQLETICRAVNVPQDIADAVNASNAPDAEKMAIIRAAIPAQPVIRTAANHNDASLDNPAVLRRAAIEYFDAHNRGEAPTGQAIEVFANGERGLAERICRSNGINTTGLSDQEVNRRAVTTSDFPIIAGGTFNLAMRRELDTSAAPITALYGRDTVSTFNAETRALADWTSLAIADRLESGHYKHSFIHESGETVQATVMGGITSKSYELNINAGSRLGNDGAQFGKRLSAEIADRMTAYVEQDDHAGPKMSDNKSVFDASRGNIQAFTIDGQTEIAQVMAMRTTMAKRKGKGDVMIGVYPTHWMVHSDFEEQALRLLAAVQASAIADVNPLAGKLQVVVEPRLNDPSKSWLVADPSKMDGAVRVYLQGQEAPFTDSRINFETDAVQFKIRHPFGLGWLEWRSWTRLDHAAE